MAVPPAKDSKRKSLHKSLQRGIERVFGTERAPSRSPSQKSGSTGALSSGVRPTSPALSITTSQQQASNHPTTAHGLFEPSTPDIGSSPGKTTNPKATTTDKLREARNVALSGLETALRILEKSADAFPPLKSAVGGFVACLDIVQSTAINSEDYKQLTSDLTMMASTLDRYRSEFGREQLSKIAEGIALSIGSEVARIGKQQERGEGRRLVESSQDKEDIVKSYRKIEGLFRQLQSEISLQTLGNANKLRVRALLQDMSPVEDARYNSSFSTTIKRRGCTAETREQVQAELQRWVQDPNSAIVYWMNGMAGTGKTTIAYSLCEWLEKNRRLGASFFCSRVSPLCRNVNLIVPSIAYQLALSSEAFRFALCNALEADPSISKLNVVQQFEKLIQEPLSMNKDLALERTVVVIDALDECEDDYGVRLILGTLLKLGASLPLKFFVTSRPEPAIRDNMLSRTGYSPAVMRLHDIEESIVESDIKKYLVEALGSMTPPPSDQQIEKLTKLAGKLFIYAATVVRYLASGKGNTTARLNAMLTPDSRPIENRPASRKYKELDQLYTAIIAAALNDDDLEEEEKEAMRLVLWTAVCAKEPMTIPTLATFVNLSGEHVEAALKPLYSVLHVSEDRGLVSTLHASFPDYMLDRSRSDSFHCDRAQHSTLLVYSCFSVMKAQLRFNICDLESSYVFDKDVPDLDQRIRNRVPPTLIYACTHWGNHLRLVATSELGGVCERLAEFLNDQLLFWVEVLNLHQCAEQGISILSHIER